MIILRDLSVVIKMLAKPKKWFDVSADNIKKLKHLLINIANCIISANCEHLSNVIFYSHNNCTPN